MPIEANTFSRILSLPPEDIAELVETVCAAALASEKLNENHTAKLSIGGIMAHYSYKLMEQCGCLISSRINNPDWHKEIVYKTQDKHSGGPNGF